MDPEKHIALLQRRLEECQRIGGIGSWEFDLGDGEGKPGTVWWSDKVYRLLGVEPGTLEPGCDAYIAAVHPGDRERVVAAGEELLRSGAMAVDHRICLPQGGERSLHIRGHWVRDEASGKRHASGTIMDITERVAHELALDESQGQLEQRVAERTGQLESLNRELEAFSYSISHDLRAPLRSIDGFARLLLEDFAADLPAPAVGHLGRITRSAAQMGRLIDGLLDYTRVGRQGFTVTHIDMDSLVDTALAQLGEEGAGREVAWERTALPPATGDAQLLRQVWLQLLGNALKFTRGRSPARIAIGSEETAGINTYYVRDNGVGFDPRYADRLFGVFQRLHRADQFEGSGVGLAIARRALERHGGAIRIEGAVDAGAIVRFTLGTPA